MGAVLCDGQLAENQFAAFVDELASSGEGRAEIVGLLRESHPVYEQRGSAATVRMRGWLLLSLARIGVTESDLVYALEELDNGRDAYLVAAAARALRTYPKADASYIPIVQSAIETIRYHDDAVSLSEYGGYAVAASVTSAVKELQQTLNWLEAKKPAPVVARHHCCCPAEPRAEVESAGAKPAEVMPVDGRCAAIKPSNAPPSCASAVFEDHDGNWITFSEFFHGKPAIVVFFYTRCNNPRKCSLTIEKLGKLQKSLRERGLAGAIRTAAITYDPDYDLPERLRNYAENRGVQLDADHRMLRTVEGWDAVREYFELGVNFVGSIVNRHRVELFVMDPSGGIAASLERLQWGEEEVMDCAISSLRPQVNAVVSGRA